MNTYEPALDIIKNKAYSVYCNVAEDDDSYDDWTANKNGFEISATNPVELLGLIIIYEAYGKDWREKQYESKYKDYMKTDSNGFIDHMLRRN